MPSIGEPGESETRTGRLEARAPRARRRGLTIETRSGRKVSSLWLIVLVAGLVVLSVAYFGRRSGEYPAEYHNDFNVYYFAAREVVSGHGPYQTSLGAWTPYLYPPLLAELLVPLAVQPLRIASYIWTLINTVALIAAAWLSSESLSLSLDGQRGRGDRVLKTSALLPGVLGLAVVFRFALDSLDLGQVNPLICWLTVASVYYSTKGKRGDSGVATAVAASIKLTPLVLLAYHVVRGRIKFAIGCAVFFLVLNAVSFAVLGSNAVSGLMTFWNRTIRNEQGYDLAYAGNQSLRGMTARLKPGNATYSDSGKAATAESNGTSIESPLAVILSLAMFVVACVAASRAANEAVAAAPFFCLMVLLSPLAWKAHFLLLLFPAAVLIKAATSGERFRALFWTTAVASLALFNLTSPRVIGLRAAEWCDVHSAVFLGGFVLFSSTILIAFTTRSAPPRGT